MSLLDEAMENFIVIDKQTVLDGYGGTETKYVDGVTIQAALSFGNSTEIKVAQAAGVKDIYTITVRKAINLDFHALLKQASTGRIFQLTNDGDDNKTPASAALDMRQYSAELFTLE